MRSMTVLTESRHDCVPPMRLPFGDLLSDREDRDVGGARAEAANHPEVSVVKKSDSLYNTSDRQQCSAAPTD